MMMIDVRRYAIRLPVLSVLVIIAEHEPCTFKDIRKRLNRPLSKESDPFSKDEVEECLKQLMSVEHIKKNENGRYVVDKDGIDKALIYKEEKRRDKVVPQWAKKRGNTSWLLFRPKYITVVFGCGNCTEENEVILPTRIGRHFMLCIFCKTRNQIWLCERKF